MSQSNHGIPPSRWTLVKDFAYDLAVTVAVVGVLFGSVMLLAWYLYRA